MAPVLPANGTEKLLLKRFHDALQTSKVDFGVETNLIEWGATSLDIIKLKGQIQREVGFPNEISMSTILSNPTVRSLAQMLTEKATSREIYNPVVILQPKGKKIPLWLIHPDNGEVLIFLGLAKHIADRPVCALRARGLNPSERCFSSISEAVTIYCAAIKSQQPHGPYALAGYAYGFMLAFEVAKVLIDDGNEVRFLGFLDPSPHIKHRRSPGEWSLCLMDLAISLGLISHEYSASVSPYFYALSKGEAVQHIHHAADPSLMAELSLTGGILADWADVTFALQSMAVGYEPVGEVNSIDVFYDKPSASIAKSSEVWFGDRSARLEQFGRDVRFYDVECSDDAMLGPRVVETFQKILNKVC